MLQNLHDMFLTGEDGRSIDDLSSITLARASEGGLPEYVKESSFHIGEGEGLPFMSPQHIRNCLDYIRAELYLPSPPLQGLVGDEKAAYEQYRRQEEVRLRKKRKDFDEEVFEVLLDHIRILEELCHEIESGVEVDIARTNYLRKWEIYVE